jgi:hypothetical protein
MKVEARWPTIALLVSFAACSRATSAANRAGPTSPTDIHTPPATTVHIGKYGVACRIFSSSGPQELGPPSYPTSAIGKSGVPALTSSQDALINQIQRYIHTGTVRFSFLRWPPGFVIFDPGAGPCTTNIVPVLNSKRDIYQPGEASTTHVYTGFNHWPWPLPSSSPQ